MNKDRDKVSDFIKSKTDKVILNLSEKLWPAGVGHWDDLEPPIHSEK